jgi:purine-binding chemotaxis protein CheW
MSNEVVQAIEAGKTTEIKTELATNLEVCQFVTFIVGDEVFAVGLDPVQEIIRVPDVVRVPMSPNTLLGLANLRGKVLPIVSLHRIFGFTETAHGEATRAVIIDQGSALGFVVDCVASVVSVEANKIEGVDGLHGSVNTEFISGLLKDVGGHQMIMVLDFAKLISQEFSTLTQSRARESTAGGERSLETEVISANSEELQLVSFMVAEQEYAISIDDVQEIVQVPENIVQVPHSESHVLGLMTLRNRLLPVVSLRRMFKLPAQALSEHSRIVVVSLNGASVGVLMDSANEVLRVAKSNVDSMPGLLSRDSGMSDISDICRLDDGRRLVSIISVANMFHHSAIQEAVNTVNNTESNATDLDAGVEDDEQVVVFRLGDEEFGIAIDSVQEIVRVPEVLTHVPRAPAFVEGVINLRGAVLPVIDQRLRLGMTPSERNDMQRIMVFLVHGNRTGFIVDSVTEVLKIAKSSIEVAPQFSVEELRLIDRVANLEQQQRMIQLIDPTQLLANQELAGLASMAAVD